MSKFRRLVNNWQLLLIILIGFLFRLYKLNFQSLWLDELHTMNEAAPQVSWSQLFQSLKCCDPHPPLQFIIAKISFGIFGYTQWVARVISVLAGTLSIWAMYILGKQFMDKRLGIIAAIITCVNFYNLSYSQEARCYIFAFLFAALSFSWWMRLVKQPTTKNALLYGFFSLCLLYSHYYSLFVIAAQALLSLVMILEERGNDRKKLFTLFCMGGAVMVVGYIPWIPIFLAQMKIKSFWISEIPAGFLQEYFFQYFGNSDLLKPLLLVVVFIYVARISLHTSQSMPAKLKSDPLSFGFVIILAWIFITLLIPYVRSLLVVPMLFPRYSIVILPAVIIVLSYGITLFRVQFIQYALVSLFVLLSVVDLLVTRHYYSTVSKTQFREITRFIVDGNESNYPIVNAKTGWHQQYYLNHYGSKADLIYMPGEAFIDSVVTPSSSKWGMNGFWLVGMHADAPPAKEKLALLDSAYTLLKENQLHDAWAQLYVLKSLKPGYVQLRYNDFTDGTTMPDQKELAIWGGTVHSRKVHLKKGSYKITISSRGTESGNVYPHLNVRAGDKKLGDYFTTPDLTEKDFVFKVLNDEEIIFSIEMDNDAYVPGKSDRNAFVKSLTIEVINNE